MRLVALKMAGIAWALLAGAACAEELQSCPDVQPTPAPDSPLSGDLRLLELLDESIAYLNERLPFQIDLATRLIGVSREGRTLVYQYQVEQVSLNAIEGQFAVLSRRTCRNEQLFNLMSIGGAVRYSYELRESGQRVVHEITLQKCNAGTTAV